MPDHTDLLRRAQDACGGDHEDDYDVADLRRLISDLADALAATTRPPAAVDPEENDAAPDNRAQSWKWRLVAGLGLGSTQMKVTLESAERDVTITLARLHGVKLSRIGEAYGISPERVRQISEKVLRRLRRINNWPYGSDVPASSYLAALERFAEVKGAAARPDLPPADSRT